MSEGIWDLSAADFFRDGAEWGAGVSSSYSNSKLNIVRESDAFGLMMAKLEDLCTSKANALQFGGQGLCTVLIP